tara:strand:+ start:18101 stop:18802 length:702 start_codon:yes stop_codon:yes gene_type:complete
MRPFSDNEVEDLFNDLSARYDLFNDIFSFGLHRLWKKQLLDYLKPKSGEHWIDFCCGTGDLTLSIGRLVGPEGKVFGIDSAEKTILIAKKKAGKGSSLPITWINEDIVTTTLSPNLFDGAVMAYGLRNIVDPLIGLKSIRRLLRKDARAGVLDFARPPRGTINEWFQKIYLSKIVIPVTSNFALREHFEYLADSLKFFPDGNVQKELAIQAGFSEAAYHYLAGGQMGILLLKC